IPGQIALAAIIYGRRNPPGYVSELTFDTFLGKFNDPRQWQVDESESVPTTYFADQLEQLKIKHFERFSIGLDAGKITDYMDEWELVIREARAALVPNNAPDPDLAAVVLTDIV